jgi:hypothetical protein
MSEAKRYPITFTTDYTEEWYRKHYTDTRGDVSKHVAICEKYKGKSISLEELPALVEELDHSVIFNGETIEIYNDYRE